MPRAVTRLFARLAVLFAVPLWITTDAAQGDRPWPPAMQVVSDESPVRSAEAEMQTFVLPPGYHVQLVASEPLIQDPILIDWDPDGRMWAIELPNYMNDMPGTNEHAATGRIVVLEDTNKDGRMDKRTVFMDGLELPRALKVLDRGVLVAEPPNLWLMHDTNGDLKGDTKELITGNYGTQAAGPEHNANSLFWALDNWIYTAEHDGYLRLKNGQFELQKTLSRGQWGVTMDDAGRIFRNTNEAALFVDYVPARYYMRNPNLVRTRGLYDSLENREVNTVWPARQTRGVNRGYQNGVLRPDGSLAAFTAVNSPTVYRGDRLPAELRGNVFVAEPAGNLVSRLILSDDGTGLKARKAYPQGEFLASTDERFRPVNLSAAPDGALYIVDMYRGIIQHRNFITEYLRDHIVAHKLELPTGFGRIYRVVHDTTKLDRTPALSKASTGEMLRTLSHPNGWWRDTAQRLLVERGDRTALGALKKLAEGKVLPARLHALWILDALDAIEPSTVLKALADPSRDVRLQAVQLSERWLDLSTSAVPAALVKHIDDPDWAVRRQVAASLGALPASAKDDAIATMLEKHGDDPVTIDAALSGLRGEESAVVARLLRATTPTPPVEAALTMLAATVIRTADDSRAQALFDTVADSARPDWQRAALLLGAEVALLGSAMPGTPARGGGAAPTAAAPCPTCPGARAGPGGASAFGAAPTTPAVTMPRPPAGAAPPPATGATRTLRLAKPPARVVALAGEASDLGRRAGLVLARVEWPGKPGMAAPVTLLTADEELRYNAGRQVYQNLCAACHQPDGRGREKVAPSLVGSALALAAGDVTVRILMNGKEGAIGLMPPLASALSDDQIAGVLTYVRREWGQAGAPVTAATVRDVRALTATRGKPWTDAELLALQRASQ